jgi:hypothetical protein
MRHLSGDGPEKPAEYRARAKWLIERASDAPGPELRAVYLDLAQQWAALAEYAAANVEQNRVLEDAMRAQQHQVREPSPEPAPALGD